MVLHRKQRKLAMADPFNRTVIQIDVRDCEIGGARNPVRLSNYREPMVLSGDKHLTAPKIANRMITSPVPVGQLGCGTTIGQADELVAETDPERGQPGVGELADGWQGLAHGSGIARSVGKQEAVRA